MKLDKLRARDPWGCFSGYSMIATAAFIVSSSFCSWVTVDCMGDFYLLGYGVACCASLDEVQDFATTDWLGRCAHSSCIREFPGDRAWLTGRHVWLQRRFVWWISCLFWLRFLGTTSPLIHSWTCEEYVYLSSFAYSSLCGSNSLLLPGLVGLSSSVSLPSIGDCSICMHPWLVCLTVSSAMKKTIWATGIFLVVSLAVVLM